jgi:ComEC/Rec2-related protein
MALSLFRCRAQCRCAWCRLCEALLHGALQWRRDAPACVLAAGVVLGQLLMWCCSLAAAVGVLLACGVRYLCCRQRAGVLSAGFLLGVISGTVALLDRPTRTVAPVAHRLLQLREAPRHPRPGEVVFFARDLLDATGTAVRCTAVDLPWRNAALLRPGSVVWVRGEFEPVPRPMGLGTGPGGPFSWEGYLWRQGVSASCRARYLSRPLSQPQGWVWRWRERIQDGVLETAGDGRGSALLLSMVFGFRDLLSDPVEDAFRSLGLSHLLVVSGYQVSLVFAVVAGWLGWVVRLARVRRGAATMVTTAAVLTAALFVALIGTELSALRALVAAVCLGVTMLSERSARFSQRLGVALLVVLLLSPWAFFDMGVQLTFAALTGIGIGMRLGGRRRLLGYLAVTVCAGVCTSAVVVAWTGQFAPVGFMLNLVLAAPWASVNCVCGGVGVVVALLVGPAAAWLLAPIVWLNTVISGVILRIADSPLRGVELQGGWWLGTFSGLVLAVVVLGVVAARPPRSLVE